ncbi:hypothetical protein [Herminiimonas sp. CN]|uniref:hypothetical protein n=1 Tax=Herminiimonas sp. CN TaxID=1349818 RepID=UPI0012DEA151|nr:hypothetical protein [Herminiimonas sp. CN]
MFTLPKGTIVKFRGLPFMLLEDAPTDGSEENYKLAFSQELTSGGSPAHAASPFATFETKSASSASIDLLK